MLILPSKPTEAVFTSTVPALKTPTRASTTPSSSLVWTPTRTTSSRTHGAPPGVIADSPLSVQSTTAPCLPTFSHSHGDTNLLEALSSSSLLLSLLSSENHHLMIRLFLSFLYLLKFCRFVALTFSFLFFLFD